MNFKITIKGSCAIKKNTIKELWWRYETMPGGGKRRVPREKPVKYYTPAYTNWAKEAITQLAVFKSNLAIHNNKLPNGEELIFPITTPIFLTCIFFVDHRSVTDISNMMESPQDVLAGNAGSFLDKTSRGVKIKYDHSKYRIISDDNYKIVKNLGGSTILYDAVNPRTEIFISSYSPEIYKQMFALMHPGQKISILNPWEDQPSLDFGGEFDNIFD